LLALLLLFAASAASATPGPPAGATTETIAIDAAAPSTPFPHYWEKMFGSGRAVLSLRASYREDLHEVKGITGFEYVRFHDILDDDMGVYSEDAAGKPIYNFSYVDQVYDGLLQSGVKPVVELSFTPRKLSVEPPTVHPFWYHPLVSPPRDYDRWGELVYEFTKHLVERYGMDEVARWYFEVWNEPNIDFWAGEPKEPTYYQLYDHAAHAIKRVSPRLRVGGPATAQAAWVDKFIRHCVENKVPFDFVSTHVYGNDLSRDVFGIEEDIPRDKMVCRAVRKVHDQVKASSRPDVPLIWSEYNASYKNEVDVTDSTYMGPWLADTIRQCDGLVDVMSYWTFSDVFDEQGVVTQPFYGGFGLLAAGGLPKPAFNAFKLLHRLGSQRLAVDSESVLATRRADGTLVIATWNLSPPDQAGAPRTVTLRIAGARSSSVTLHRLDGEHGDIRPAYERMGRPRYPTQAQLRELRKAAQLPAPERVTLKGGVITITLAAKGLALLEVR